MQAASDQTLPIVNPSGSSPKIPVAREDGARSRAASNNCCKKEGARNVEGEKNKYDDTDCAEAHTVQCSWQNFVGHGERCTAR